MAETLEVFDRNSICFHRGHGKRWRFVTIEFVRLSWTQRCACQRRKCNQEAANQREE